MAEFKYEGLADNGKPQSGVTTGETLYQAIRALAADKIRVYRIDSRGRDRGFYRSRGPLSAEEVNAFNEQLDSIVRSGLPLPDAIRALGKEMRTGRLRELCASLAQDLESGTSLSDALAGDHTGIPEMYANMLRAGEESGNLPAVLTQIVKHGRERYAFASRMRAALVYPFFSAVFCSIIALGLFIFVLPKHQEIFYSLSAELPEITQITFTIVNALRFSPTEAGVLAYGLIGAAIAAQIAWNRMRRSSGSIGRATEHMVRLLPLWGPATRASAECNFARTLDVMLKSRVALPEALVTAGASSDSAITQMKAIVTANAVSNGKPLGEALTETGLLRTSYAWLVAQGESRESLEEAVERLANISSREAQARLDSVLRYQPILALALVGLGVLIMLLSVFLPIFGMTQIVG